MDTRSPPGELSLPRIPFRGNLRAYRRSESRPLDDFIPTAEPSYRSPRRLILWAVSLSTALWGLAAMVFFWWVY
jgi:hypothetical protein